MGRPLKERTRFVEDMEAWNDLQQKVDDGTWQLGVQCFYAVQQRLREQERHRAEKERQEREALYERKNQDRIWAAESRKKQDRYTRYWTRQKERADKERLRQRQYKEWGLTPGVWETEDGKKFVVDP